MKCTCTEFFDKFFHPQESDSNSDTTDSSPDTRPDYDSENGCQTSRVEHSRTLSTSDMENYLGMKLPKIRRKGTVKTCPLQIIQKHEFSGEI